ncbi:MAG: hypothetical protein LBT63_01430 [Holosporaceae bacterium]|nr:hypothetical protein [Holosporaceae bacterium]
MKRLALATALLLAADSLEGMTNRERFEIETGMDLRGAVVELYLGPKRIKRSCFLEYYEYENNKFNWKNDSDCVLEQLLEHIVLETMERHGTDFVCELIFPCWAAYIDSCGKVRMFKAHKVKFALDGDKRWRASPI